MSTATKIPKPARKTGAGGFIVRPIHSHEEYDAAVEVMNKLAIQPEGSLSRDDQDRLDLLTLVVGDYDDKHFKPKVRARRSPVETLKYLMRENDLKAIDLAELFGGRSRVSDVLCGKRELSKAQIVALSKRFHINPGVFLLQ